MSAPYKVIRVGDKATDYVELSSINFDWDNLPVSVICGNLTSHMYMKDDYMIIVNNNGEGTLFWSGRADWFGYRVPITIKGLPQLRIDRLCCCEDMLFLASDCFVHAIAQIVSEVTKKPIPDQEEIVKDSVMFLAKRVDDLEDHLTSLQKAIASGNRTAQDDWEDWACSLLASTGEREVFHGSSNELRNRLSEMIFASIGHQSLIKNIFRY